MALKRKSPKGNGGGSKVVSGILQDGAEVEARLVYVADLGLQERIYKGDVKPPAQQLALGFEIIGEIVELEDGDKIPKVMWTNPFNIFHELTDKGKELVYYKVFSPAAKAGEVADWEMALGMPCNITVSHFTNKENATYDNIGAITPIPKKYQDAVGQATIEPCIGDSEDEENPCTKALFGLAKYVWEKRIVDDEDNCGVYTPEPYQADGDDVPF